MACPSGVEAVLLNCTIPVAGKQPDGMVKLVVGGPLTEHARPRVRAAACRKGNDFRLHFRLPY